MNIRLNENPAISLRTLELARYTRSTHKIRSVPARYDALRIYIHRPTALKSYFIAFAQAESGGDFRFTVDGGMLPDIGTATYEVFGIVLEKGSEEQEFLGEGAIHVTEKALPGTPAKPLEVPARVVIYDEAGAAHYLTAVPDGMGNFTSIVD